MLGKYGFLSSFLAPLTLLLIIKYVCPNNSVINNTIGDKPYPNMKEDERYTVERAFASAGCITLPSNGNLNDDINKIKTSKTLSVPKSSTSLLGTKQHNVYAQQTVEIKSSTLFTVFKTIPVFLSKLACPIKYAITKR